MKKSAKKILSCFLAVLMLVCGLPFGGSITANAAGGVKSKLDSFISSYPSGSRWTGYFDGGKQCYGFGKLVIYNIFGKYGSSYRSWSYQGVSTSGMNSIGSITSYSSSNVKSLLSKAKCGDVLQFDYTKQHTMIVYSVESDGVWIYDCNWDNNCGISLRKCSFGAWSGRNSAKLTLLRSNNYDSIEGPAVTHTVNSNYGKNYTAYLNNPGTNHYVFDANHNSTSHYVNGSDPCTIHEVYTDGCCYFTYSLDSGGTRNAYGKISWFKPAHTHSYQEGYEAAHPHKVYKKCSCGDYYYTGKNATHHNCTQCCDNATYTLTASPSSLTMYVGETKTVTFTESSSGFTVYMNGKYTGAMFSNVSIGDWIDGCKRKVTFTAIKAGTGTIAMELKAALTDKVMKTLVYNVNILPDKYTVSYNANGGSGAPSSQTKNYKTTLTLSSTKPTRSGYTFKSWNTKADGTGTSYSPGAKYTSNANVTLYAQWSHTHSYTSSITKAATCTQTGIKTFKCSTCGNTYTETIPVTGHKEVIDKAIAATCKTEGKTQGSHCSVCGYVIKAQTVIKKTPHTYTLAVKDPTCTENGATIYTCSACGDTYSESIPAIGHIDDDGDGMCDLCNKNLGGGVADCDHICHKGGFSGFIYKIIRIFWKLFKINKTCACGVNHY